MARFKSPRQRRKVMALLKGLRPPDVGRVRAAIEKEGKTFKHITTGKWVASWRGAHGEDYDKEKAIEKAARRYVQLWMGKQRGTL